MSCVIALTRYFAVSLSGMAHDLSDICSGASDRCNAMKKLIYTLACVLMVSAISIPFAMARDQNWNSLQHRLAEEQRQQKRWQAVVHSTGAARQEALQQYLYNLPELWDDQSAP